MSIIQSFILKRLTDFLGNSEEYKDFKDMAQNLSEYLVQSQIRVLDIASDKPPVFTSLMARSFPEAEFVHFKDDNVRSEKVMRKFSSIPNLKIVYSKRDLNPPYNLAMGFFTLHELKDPKKTIEKTMPLLNANGKIMIIDYNLGWFQNMVKENNLSKDQRLQTFKDYIFTTNNERKVLREEEDCISHHTKYSLADFVGRKISGTDRRTTGLKDLLYKEYPIETPGGNKPKSFLYIGEKI